MTWSHRPQRTSIIVAPAARPCRGVSDGSLIVPKSEVLRRWLQFRRLASCGFYMCHNGTSAGVGQDRNATDKSGVI